MTSTKRTWKVNLTIKKNNTIKRLIGQLVKLGTAITNYNYCEQGVTFSTTIIDYEIIIEPSSAKFLVARDLMYNILKQIDQNQFRGQIIEYMTTNVLPLKCAGLTLFSKCHCGSKPLCLFDTRWILQSEAAKCIKEYKLLPLTEPLTNLVLTYIDAYVDTKEHDVESDFEHSCVHDLMAQNTRKDKLMTIAERDTCKLMGKLQVSN